MNEKNQDNIFRYLSDNDIEEVRKSVKKANDIRNKEIINNKGIVIYLDVLGWRNLWGRDKKALNKLAFLLQDLITINVGLIKAIEKQSEEKFAEFEYNKELSSIELIGAADTIAIFIKDYYSLAFTRAYVLINSIIQEGAKQGIFFEERYLMVNTR